MASNYDPNLWKDDQKKRDAIRACQVLSTGIPMTFSTDHNSGETCAQVIVRIGTSTPSKIYKSQEATKHAAGMVRALQAGLGWNTQSADHKNSSEPCVMTICRLNNIPF